MRLRTDMLKEFTLRKSRADLEANGLSIPRRAARTGDDAMWASHAAIMPYTCGAGKGDGREP
jgi:hypothetical protein